MDEVDEEWRARGNGTEVRDQVVEMYLDEPGVNCVEVSRGEEAIAGRLRSKITIFVEDDETADALSVPGEIDGIPLSVRVSKIIDTG